MDRRELLTTGIGCTLGTSLRSSQEDDVPLFPERDGEAYLNAAAGTPLGRFAQAGLRAFEDQHLEEVSVVVDGHAPLLVVVAHREVVGRPGAALAGHGAG